jgi:hypothetical protein
MVYDDNLHYMNYMGFCYWAAITDDHFSHDCAQDSAQRICAAERLENCLLEEEWGPEELELELRKGFSHLD